IFYDEQRVRWRFTRRVLEVSGVLLTLLLVYFFVTIAVGVDLPAGVIGDTKIPFRALETKKKREAPLPVLRRRHRAGAEPGTVPSGYDPLRAAFYVSYDANSLASLKKHYKDLDLLIPEELHAVTPDGALTVVDYVRYETVKASPEEAYARLREDKLHQWMKSI